MFYIGADVSRGRWLTVKMSEDESWEVQLFETIGEMWDGYHDARLILIDVPIGLHEGGGEERLCDKKARRLLGWPRRSSVFRVPCRAALKAVNYDDAKRISIERTGKSLPTQSWGIIPKIREVDRFLKDNINARARIREVHPEVCFWALNGGTPMRYRKKDERGLLERRQVLRGVCSFTDDLVEHALEKKRGKATEDDILDALVAAVTASKSIKGLSFIPDEPEIDSVGLLMQMAYHVLQKPVPFPRS